MLKKKTLWYLLTIAVMILFAGSITVYASETETIAEEISETETISTDVETDENETSKVITVGEASSEEDTSSEEEISEEIISDDASENSHDHVHGGLQSLGMFRTTGYCPCYRCSEGWGRLTSTGATAKSSHTVAVDPRVIPYGTKLMIGGVIYTAEDRGGGVKGNHIDIFFDSHTQTRQHGSRQQEVFLVS